MALALRTALVLLAACGPAAASANPPVDAGADGEGAECVAASLVLSGPAAQAPHGTYGLSNVVTSTSSFSATLPAGGSLAISWSGDATAGPVVVTGRMLIPPDDGGPAAAWCIYAPSTLTLQGHAGRLDLRVLPEMVDCALSTSTTTDVVSACFVSA